MQRQEKLEEVQKNMADSITSAQQKYTDEKGTAEWKVWCDQIVLDLCSSKVLMLF